MAISLQKGQKISLEKEAPGLEEVRVGLGWDAGENFDLDVSVFLLNKDKKITEDKDFVFYRNETNANSSVIHSGDNLTGEGDGEDEFVKVKLSEVPENVEEIVFVCSIFEASKRNQNFGQVNDAFIRLVDTKDEKEIAKFDLTEDFSIETSITMGRLYRHSGSWKFDAMGKGENKELDYYLDLYN
jgi:tellurium resistance protein TerD